MDTRTSLTTRGNNNPQQTATPENAQYIPDELILLILSWLSPFQVLQYSSLSSSLHSRITSHSFATLNLSRAIPRIEHGKTDSNVPRFYDRFFFTASLAYQNAYCDSHLQPLKKIQWLDFKVSRPIPNAVSQLVRLETLCLNRCGLIGCIPDSIGELKALKCLDLRWNLLEGSIPARIGDMEELRELWLLQNRLTGVIPREIGMLKRLRVLALGYNLLEGEIPEELSELDGLVHFSVEGNALSGEVPSGMLKLTKLKSCLVAKNQITFPEGIQLPFITKLKY
ncbi:hypothetical protein HDU79_010070 [Rhizoclosmatium sp. JEL0117]|nr:hypothetical protein HDU79_010070 [Rhizoclosmatium sp. JEL0117]